MENVVWQPAGEAGQPLTCRHTGCPRPPSWEPASLACQPLNTQLLDSIAATCLAGLLQVLETNPKEGTVRARCLNTATLG